MYKVAQTVDNPTFVAHRMSAPGVQYELAKMMHSTLWPQWPSFTAGTVVQHRAPLRQLSQWHLAPAPAGKSLGWCAHGGRTLFVKGDTYKTSPS